MVTPYDWQEGISHRAQYVESRLGSGQPVIALSLPEGILVATQRRQSRKVFEVYDRLLYAGVGAQADVEAVRVGAIEFAHREGFQRSEQDVTIQRVVTGLSQSIRRAFADFNSTPLVLRCLFAEVNSTPEKDLLFVLDYDGDYGVEAGKAILAGSLATQERLVEGLASFDLSQSADSALAALQPLFESEDGLRLEAALLERSPRGLSRFRHLTGGD